MLISFMCVLMTCPLLGDGEVELDAWNGKLDEWEELADRYAKSANPKDGETVERGIRTLREPWGGPPQELIERLDQVHQKLVLALLSDSDVIDSYEEEISNARAQWRGSDQALWESRNAYFNRCKTVISTLGNLPDPKSIRVLGELLNDTEAIWMPDSDEMFGPNSRPALLGLKNLVADGPEDSDDVIYGSSIDRTAWMNWFQQVKQGKRTFRFKGKMQAFNLRGPVAKELHPPFEKGDFPVPRKSLDERLSTFPSSRVLSEKANADQRSLWVMIASGLGGLALGLGAFLFIGRHWRKFR